MYVSLASQLQNHRFSGQYPPPVPPCNSYRLFHVTSLRNIWQICMEIIEVWRLILPFLTLWHLGNPQYTAAGADILATEAASYTMFFLCYSGNTVFFLFRSGISIYTDFMFHTNVVNLLILLIW